MRVTFIYVLEDESGFVRYVGKTVNPRNRYKSHCSHQQNNKTPSYRWIKKLARAGHKPTMRIVSAVLGGLWAPAEREWIRFFRAMGADLLNIGEGGEDGVPMTPETRLRISAALKGREITAEHRQRIAESNRSRTVSQATRDRLREANLGHKQSLACIEKRMAFVRGKKKPHGFGAKVAESNRNRVYSAETIERMRLAQAGKIISEETRQKMSAAGRGRPKSPEHVAKVAAAIRGRKNTPEQIDRLKQAWIIRKMKSAAASGISQ